MNDYSIKSRKLLKTIGLDKGKKKKFFLYRTLTKVRQVQLQITFIDFPYYLVSAHFIQN